MTELTSSNAEITWSVHLANKKSAWYQFQLARYSEAQSAPRSYLRNISVADRIRLVIDPGVREITGRTSGRPRHTFDNGEFMGNRFIWVRFVPTNRGGWLCLAAAAVCVIRRIFSSDFANNGWHDDTSDGPVATVNFQGAALEVDPPGLWSRLELCASTEISPPCGT